MTLPDPDRLAELAEFAKCMAHPHRLLLLQELGETERSVEDLARAADLSIANASQHLQLLRRAGFVDTRREGKRIFYRLCSPALPDLVSALSDHRDNVARLRAQLVSDSITRPSEVESVSCEELGEIMAQGGTVLLDVRPSDEFRQGHIPGAINLPLGELANRIGELDSGREIVAYCRGPFCVLSAEAAKLLAERGFHARRFGDGLAQWQAAGNPTEREANGASGDEPVVA